MQRIVEGYGYANGGLVSQHGLYEVAEGNSPEYIIPTDVAKRGRAWSLLSVGNPYTGINEFRVSEPVEPRNLM